MSKFAAWQEGPRLERGSLFWAETGPEAGFRLTTMAYDRTILASVLSDQYELLRQVGRIRENWPLAPPANRNQAAAPAGIRASSAKGPWIN